MSDINQIEEVATEPVLTVEPEAVEEKEKLRFSILPLVTVSGEPISDSYTVLKEFRTEFNAQEFNDQVAQVLLKYDFIVGDFADNQLRLKGFYADRRRDALPSKRAAYIERYLKHSCNYMSPHYVLEKTKRVEIVEAELSPKKPRRSSSNRNPNSRGNNPRSANANPNRDDSSRSAVTNPNRDGSNNKRNPNNRTNNNKNRPRKPQPPRTESAPPKA